MAMNEFGVGAVITAEDRASGSLEAVTDATNGLAGGFGNAGTSLTSFLGAGRAIPGMAGGAAAGLGGMAAALGPIALAIGLVVMAWSAWNDVVMKTNEIMESSIQVFGAFESRLAEVQTILGSTREEMGKITDAALDYAATYGKSSQEQLAGFYQTASAGFADAARSAQVMDSANKLAVGGVTNINSSVDLLTTILNGFSIEADRANEVSDSLFTTIKAGKTTASELAAAFGQVVPSANAAGAQLDETLAAMATLTLTGQSTAEASTALARAFDFLIKKPPAAMKKLKEYGVEAADLDVKGRGLQAVLTSIGTAFAGNEEEIALAVPQIRAFKAIMPLATSQAEKFSGILDQMADKTGATDEAFNTIANTMQFQKDRFASMVEGFRSRIGQVFAPSIRQALDIANDLLGLVEKLPPSMKNFIFTITGVGLAVPSVVNKIGGMIWTLTKLGLILVPILSVAQMMVPALLMWIPSLARMVPSLGRIIQLFVAWRDNVDGLRDRVQKFFDNFKLVIRGFGEAIAHDGDISGPIAAELEKAGLIKWISGVWVVFRRIQTFFGSFWEGFREAVLGGRETLEEIAPELTALLDVLKKGEGLGEALGKAIPVKMVEELGKKGGENLGKIIDWLGTMARDWEKNAKMVDTFVTAIMDLAEAMKTLASVVSTLQPFLNQLDRLAVALGIATPAQEGKVAGQKSAEAILGPGMAALEEQQKGPGLGVAGALATLAAPVVGLVSPAGAAALGGIGAAGREPQTINLNLTSKTEVDGQTLATVIEQRAIELAEEGQAQE